MDIEKNREINIILYINLYISFAIDRNIGKIIKERKDFYLLSFFLSCALL